MIFKYSLEYKKHMNPFNAIFPSCLSLLYIHQYSWHSYDPTPQFPHHCCTGKIIQDHQIPQARWTPIKSYTYLPMIGGCVQKSGKNPHKDDFDRTRTLNQWILCTLFSDSPYSNLVRHLFVIMVVKILSTSRNPSTCLLELGCLLWSWNIMLVPEKNEKDGWKKSCTGF